MCNYINTVYPLLFYDITINFDINNVYGKKRKKNYVYGELKERRIGFLVPFRF